jgi:hypothetical protein
MNIRNQLCPCGSGLKYKKCCGKVMGIQKADDKPETARAINQNGLNAVLWQFIASTGGKISIPLEELSKVPHKANFYSKVNEETNCVDIWVDMTEAPLITLPERRIIITGP